MPNIEACIPLNKSSEYVEWEIRITYDRSNRHDTLVLIDTVYYEQCWNIAGLLDTLIMGGEARITCKPEGDSCVSQFNFSIRGYNPSETAAESFIEDSLSGEWYNIYVAQQESGIQDERTYLQFNEIYAYNCNSADIRYTPNWGDDGGNLPGGFGMYQLTFFHDTINDTDRVPNSQELWSWKANVLSGCDCIAYHQGLSYSYMGLERSAAYDSCGLDCYFVPEEFVGNVTFQDGSNRIIEHAVAMKRYNGLGIENPPGYDVGNRQYCEWVDSENTWRFNRLAFYYDNENNLTSHNYIANVCSTVP